MATTFPTERIERSILLIRGHKVLLDVDLAALYGVPTKRLNEQVRRNRARFPEDFMFQLTAEEVTYLRSQFATSNKGRGGRRYAPYAFTEQGVAMLSTVLNSERAILVNIEIMRAFVRLFLNPVNDLNGAQRLNDWNDWNGCFFDDHDHETRTRCHAHGFYPFLNPPNLINYERFWPTRNDAKPDLRAGLRRKSPLKVDLLKVAPPKRPSGFDSNGRRWSEVSNERKQLIGDNAWSP